LGKKEAKLHIIWLSFFHVYPTLFFPDTQFFPTGFFAYQVFNEVVANLLLIVLSYFLLYLPRGSGGVGILSPDA